MKVTKNKRIQQKRIGKLNRRSQRGNAKKAAERAKFDMQSVKMRLSLSSKEGHVSSIREYLGTIEQDITHFSNATRPAIDLMDLICGDNRFTDWREANREVVIVLQDEIEFVDGITKHLRVVRDEANGELARFVETEFADREAMIQFAYGIILSIASTVETAREQFENISGTMLDRVVDIKPQLEQLLVE